MKQHTENDIEDARQWTLQYLEHSHRSQTAVAREIGISPSKLSLFLNNKYLGNNEDVAAAILQFMEIVTKRQRFSAKPDISLSVRNTEEILKKVEMAHMLGDVLLIFGDAGCGKTTALQYYGQQHKNVIYIEADVTNSSFRSILCLIAEELGISEQKAAASLMRQIVRKLKGTAAVLIIDEAQHLAPKAFDTIRALNDKAGIGIVYAGNPSIIKRMYGSREDDYDQVYSRIGFHCPLKNHYNMEDIQNIFHGYELSRDCIAYLRNTAQRKGGLRIMVKQYCMAANLASATGEAFDINHLREAGERMGLTGRNEKED